tara:strand:+ start:2175 stop:2351 length:177 start_codon:yes stop_codon:yes gene_type:complete
MTIWINDLPLGFLINAQKASNDLIKQFEFFFDTPPDRAKSVPPILWWQESISDISCWQ